MGIFFRLQVYERVGKSVIWVCEKVQKGLQMNFTASQSQENVLFLQLVPI